jgi:H+/Na+-translocating ferredoxin:NAD+ oxidoreductase subunit B
MIIQAITVLGVTGFSFAGLLAFLSKKLHVEEDPRVTKVLEALPGLNCGACGLSGCRAYAEAAVKECTLFNGCLVGGKEVNNEVSEILGVSGCNSLKTQVVACRCGAGDGEQKKSSEYFGPQTCHCANITGGAIDCSWGCIAFGDCVKICPVGALRLEKGKIIVDIVKCTGCGQCVKTCPRKLFEFIPYKENIHTCHVACSNKEKALQVKNVCTRGCIGCSLCTRVEASPYYMQENLSYIHYNDACELKPLLEGKNKCPTKCIEEVA